MARPPQVNNDKNGGIVTRSLVHLLDFIGLEDNWGTRVRAYICSNLASHIPLKTQYRLLQKCIEDRKVVDLTMDEDHDYLLFLRDSIKLVIEVKQLMVNNGKAVRYDDTLLALHLRALNYNLICDNELKPTPEQVAEHLNGDIQAAMTEEEINDVIDEVVK